MNARIGEGDVKKAEVYPGIRESGEGFCGDSPRISDHHIANLRNECGSAFCKSVCLERLVVPLLEPFIENFHLIGALRFQPRLLNFEYTRLLTFSDHKTNT